MAEGAMRIEDLTGRFGISLMAAHRDSAAPSRLIESSDIYRFSRQAAEKKAIAAAAMQSVEPGQAIFFDDSTTVLQMAALFPAKVPLTVITNSLILMNALNDFCDLTLLGLGGQYHNWGSAFMGRMTISAISRLRADTLFMSPSAITDDMVFHQSLDMVEAKRAMFDTAARRILLADHTKFGRRALHSFAALTEFDVVIVDAATPQDHVERMRAKGINVVIAPDQPIARKETD